MHDLLPDEGLRIRIEIDEDGTTTPPHLPLATLLRALDGTDGKKYFLAKLDKPVECIRAKTGQPWTLTELVLTNYFKGGNIENLTTGKREFFVFVKLLNPERSIGPNGRLDLSKAAYFGLGRAMIA